MGDGIDGLKVFDLEPRRFLASIFVYFDESGKFKDHSTIALAGVASTFNQIQIFSDEWNYWLRRSGLTHLTMKRALSFNVDLSHKMPARGLTARMNALLPFIECIRKHLELIVGGVIDVEAFNRLPPDVIRFFANDPFFLSFQRTVMTVLDHIGPSDTLSIVCDEDEETAIPTYHLYRRFKKIDTITAKRLTSFSMAADEYYTVIQAADCVASLLRLEGKKQLHGQNYDYGLLYSSLTANPDSTVKLQLKVGVWDAPQLIDLASEMGKFRDRITAQPRRTNP